MSKKPKANAVVTTIVNSFVRRSHQVVKMGYSRLKPAELKGLEEPAITGKLVDAIEAALDADDAPQWSKHFWPMDDVPTTVGTNVGKDRPRVDITIISRAAKPTQKFRFEAKRLGTSHTVGNYLGNTGMLALVTGYYGKVAWSGMLGYAESGTCADWSKKIQDAISADTKKYFTNKIPKFDALGKATLSDIFVSTHSHKKRGCSVTHTIVLAY